MKVAIYVGGVPADVGGGYTFETEVVEGFLAAFSASHHKFTFLCPDKSVPGLTSWLQATGLGVRAVATGWIDRLIQPALNTSAFVRARWKRRSTLDVAADAVGADLIWFVASGSHLTDRPYITVVWDIQHRVAPWFPELSEHGAWDMRDLVSGWFLRRATKIVTGTRAGQAELELHYQIPSERTVVLPHPTPHFVLHAAAGQKKPLGDHLGVRRPYLFYPAQFWAHKNHVNLLRALKIIRERHGLAIDLALSGSDKGNQSYVERVAKDLGLDGNVHFLGFVSRDDLIALYENALALAYVSWFGPENLPPLEAFALGCPVVASRIPGAEEQLGSAALLVAPQDPEDIAAAVMKLHQDAVLRERLVVAGMTRARQWTAKDYAAGVLKAIDQLEPLIQCWRPV